MRIFLILTFFIFISTYVSAAQNSYNLLTFNTGLAHSFVAHAKERLPEIIKALEKDDSDVVCLQEVWNKKDRQKIIKALKKKYPHSFFVKGAQLKADKTPVCRIKELFGEDRFLSCMMENCMDGDSDHQTTCSRKVCAKALIDLTNSNRQCASVLMAQVGQNTFWSMVKLFSPLKKPGLFAYEGENGLLMMSKHRMKNRKFIDWKKSSTLNHRGALFTEIDLLGKTNQFVCTHLTANLSTTIPYSGEFDSWELEQELQVLDLLKRMNQSRKPLFLMGDFNCSFVDSAFDVGGEFPKNCQKFIEHKFSDPTSEERLGCTYCSGNTLVDDSENNVALDHIFVINANYEKAEIIFDEKVTIIEKKQELITNISDHFGLKIKVLK